MIEFSLPLGPESRARWNMPNPITDEMRPLYDAIWAAIDSGIFYSSDLRAHIGERVTFTGGGTDSYKNVEGGAIGMEIYYARCRMDAERNLAAQIAALERLNLKSGDKIGSIEFHKASKGRFKAVEVLAIEGTSIKWRGSAGRFKYEGVTQAAKLERAINTARGI